MSLLEDLCQTCVERQLVMFACESIERRFENPKAYYIFYDNFYRTAVGETRWKEYLEDANKEVRIGNANTEAFALLLFVNNYKAWLYEQKEIHGDLLLTEYDHGPSQGKESIVDFLMKEQEFVLDADAENMIIQDITKSNYKKAAKARKDWLAKLIRMPICAEMKRAWTEEADENATEPAAPLSSTKERAKKRRKIMKSLRKWTGTADQGERKFKGWSDSGHRTYEKWTTQIREEEDDGRCKIWDRAYREMYASQQAIKKTLASPVEKYTVDRKKVWDFNR
jgi:hypothetical protein